MIAKRISKNFIILFSGNLISQLIVFYGLIKVAYILTPEDFGRFSFAQAIVNFFTRFTEFGMETIAVRRITQHDQNDYLVENIFCIRLILAVLIIGLALLLHLILSDSKEIFIIFILLISLVGISLTTEWYFQATEKMNYVGLIRIARSILFVVPLFMLYDDYRSDVYVSWIYSFSFITVLFFFVFLYIKRNGLFLSQITRQRIFGLVKESAPVGISGTLMQIPYYYGIFIVGVTMTNSDVGSYSAAYRPILAFWSFGIMAAYNAFFPVINSYVRDMPAFKNIVMKLTKYFVLAGLMIFILVAPFGEDIVNILYDFKYAGAGYIMQLSVIVIAIVFSRAAIEYSMLSMKMQNKYLQGMVLVSVLYLVFCYLGAIKYGLVGVVIASIISELFYSAYIFYQMRIIYKWRDVVTLFIKGITVVTISYAVFVFPNYLNYQIKFIVLYSTFISGLLLTKLISKEEVSMIIKIFSK